MSSGPRPPRELGASAFKLLVAGQITSKLAHAVFLITLTLYLKQLTDSASVIGAAQVLSYLPALALGPLAGVLVDRFDRKRLLVGSDLARGLAIMAVASLVQNGGTPVVLLFVLTSVVSVSQVVFLPTVQAILPDIVAEANLRSANAIRGAGVQLSNLAGNALGGMLFSVLGGPLLLLCTGATFVVSAAQEQLMRIPRRPRGRSAGGIAGQTRSALRYLRVRRGTALAVVTHGVVGLSFPPLLLALPFVVLDDLGLSETFFGIYLAVVLAGGIAGYLWYARARPTQASSPGGEYRILRRGFFILALGIITAGARTTAPALFPAFAAAGLGAGMVNLSLITTLQRRTPAVRRGRVFGVYETVAAAASALGFGVFGPVVELMRNHLSLLVLGVGVGLAIYGVIVLRLPVARSFFSGGSAAGFNHTHHA